MNVVYNYFNIINGMNSKASHGPHWAASCGKSNPSFSSGDLSGAAKDEAGSGREDGLNLSIHELIL